MTLGLGLDGVRTNTIKGQLLSLLSLAALHGTKKIEAMFEIRPGYLHKTRAVTRLPRSGIWSLPHVLPVLERAREIYRRGEKDPVRALFAAAKQFGRNKNSLKVYLWGGGFPSLPGFPLFKDALVQQKAEEIAAGRRTSVLDETLNAGRVAPAPTAPAPAKKPWHRDYIREGRVVRLLPRRG